MYFLIATFYIAFSGIITMILLKRVEIKRGDISKQKSESRLEKTLAYFFGQISQFYQMINRRTFVALVQYLTFHALLRIRNIYVDIKHKTLLNPHGKRMIDAVRGRGEIKNHGASFYLRRISER